RGGKRQDEPFYPAVGPYSGPGLGSPSESWSVYFTNQGTPRCFQRVLD
ncbi:hypothetical protein JMJ77_0007089, partial [Colletotrichum scovillei]